MPRTNPKSPSLPSEPSASPATAAAGRWAGRLALLALVALHGWQTLRLFPSWQALGDDRPIISVDHAIHIFHGYLGA